MRSGKDQFIILATMLPIAACLVFYVIWQNNGGGPIVLPYLPIPAFDLPALPNVTLPDLSIPVPTPLRNLGHRIASNPVAITSAVVGGTIFGMIVVGMVADALRGVYRLATGGSRKDGDPGVSNG